MQERSLKTQEEGVWIVGIGKQSFIQLKLYSQSRIHEGSKYAKTWDGHSRISRPECA